VLMRRSRSRPPAPRSSFTGFRFPPEVITVAVRWYLRYGLSYRDVKSCWPSAASRSTTLRGVHTLRDMGSVQRRTRGRARGEGGVLGWVGQPAAIYCRISKARDEDQTGVDRQERLCREVAARLGLVILPGAVFG
jgi:hypothetical protein